MEESNNSNKRKQVGRVIAVEVTDEEAAVEAKRDIAKGKKQKQKQHIAMVKEQIFKGDVWTEELFVSNPDSKINLYEDNLKLKAVVSEPLTALNDSILGHIVKWTELSKEEDLSIEGRMKFEAKLVYEMNSC